MGSSLYIGLLSGTSLDAIDAALLSFDNELPTLISTESHELPANLRKELLRLFEYPDQADLRVLGKLDRELGECFASTATRLITKAAIDASAVVAIGSHGQTLWHQPGENGFTWQMGDPNIIAAKTGIKTVADFRRMDIALGGQGAPLAPAFHRVVFASADEYRVVVNIGGISNLTLLPTEETVHGFDAGPGNVLMDAWCRRHRDQKFDCDGEWATSGTVIQELLDSMLAHDFFAKSPPKSTGRETFHLAWVDGLISKLEQSPRLQDVQATLAELTASAIGNAVRDHAADSTRVLICGGGGKNLHLMKRLRAHLQGRSVSTTAEYGLNPGWVEAAVFAWLAKETIAGRPIDLPAITGSSKAAILGGIYSV
ncbi:MAG: anhydro-N-acetylmuramic acid kinase [Proteobacteria bacterium]|nr:anhydro-N-acetylmuramic acid kinase [Pseudomonadota bacterium]